MERFKKYAQMFIELNESFDSRYDVKKYTSGKTEYYEFITDDGHNYRVFIEHAITDDSNIKGIHVGFQRYDDGMWVILGVTRDNKNALKIFGTVKYVIDNTDFDILLITSDEQEKFIFYMNVFRRILPKLKDAVYDMYQVDKWLCVEKTPHVETSKGYISARKEHPDTHKLLKIFKFKK